MNLVEKLVEVSKDIGFLDFDAKNDHFGYGYASAAGVIRKLNKALGERGVLLTTEEMITNVEKDGNLVFVHCTALFRDSESGEVVRSHGLGAGSDKGDKAVMKASTAAYKYAISHALTLGWGASDPEADSATDKAPRTRTTRKKVDAKTEVEIKEALDKASAKELPSLMKEIIKHREDKNTYAELRLAYNHRKDELKEVAE